MLRGTRSLIVDILSDIPYITKSSHPNKTKFQLFLTFLRISIKLFTIHRISKITEDQIFGLKVSCFDYGTLHFLFREIFIHNLYYFKAKTNTPLIFDCGANMGMATLYLKWLYPDAIIHAFEPDPSTFALLEKNIKQNNLKNVYLHEVALLDKSGTTSFFIDKEHPGWLTMSVLQERLPKDKITVKVRPLSSFITSKPVDFLKMDVEGVEPQILSELAKAQKLHFIREMVIEYHHGIGTRKLSMSDFLSLIEENRFLYRISAAALPLYQQSVTEDINVYAYKAE